MKKLYFSTKSKTLTLQEDTRYLSSFLFILKLESTVSLKMWKLSQALYEKMNIANAAPYNQLFPLNFTEKYFFQLNLFNYWKRKFYRVSHKNLVIQDTVAYIPVLYISDHVAVVLHIPQMRTWCPGKNSNNLCSMFLRENKPTNKQNKTKTNKKKPRQKQIKPQNK